MRRTWGAAAARWARWVPAHRRSHRKWVSSRPEDTLPGWSAHSARIKRAVHHLPREAARALCEQFLDTNTDLPLFAVLLAPRSHSREEHPQERPPRVHSGACRRRSRCRHDAQRESCSMPFTRCHRSTATNLARATEFVFQTRRCAFNKCAVGHRSSRLRGGARPNTPPRTAQKLLKPEQKEPA